jgi:PIN domain nuclease of toxin-antitoxin system
MILLDTSALLWLVLDPRRLGAGTTELLSGGDDAWFSSISTLEIAIKQQLGRLQGGDAMRDRLVEQGLRELVFTSAHAEALREFPDLPGTIRSIGPWSRKRTRSEPCS